MAASFKAVGARAEQREGCPKSLKRLSIGETHAPNKLASMAGGDG